MKAQAKIAIDCIYDILGVIPTNSRKHEQVRIRAAIGVVLSNYFTQAEAGKLIGRDRCTIIHYEQCHEASLDYWKGYKHAYTIAKEVIDDLMKNEVRKQKTMLIEVRLRRHREAIQELEEQLQKLT